MSEQKRVPSGLDTEKIGPYRDSRVAKNIFRGFAAAHADYEQDYSRYECPYCGRRNTINSSECVGCLSSLEEYEAQRFAKWNHFNKALDLAKTNDFGLAREHLAVFLDMYPADRTAGRLRLLILAKTNDQHFDSEAESFMSTFNDRWAADLQDNPDSMAFDDIEEKTNFRGDSNTQESRIICSPTPIEAKIITEAKNIHRLLDVINSAFDIHSKNCNKSLRRRGKVRDEFEYLYTHALKSYLAQTDLKIEDFTGRIYDTLTEEERSSIASVDTVCRRGKPEGFILRTYKPAALHHGVIVQRAHVEVNRKLDKAGDR